MKRAELVSIVPEVGTEVERFAVEIEGVGLVVTEHRINGTIQLRISLKRVVEVRGVLVIVHLLH